VAIVPAAPSDRAQARSPGASDVATFVAIAPAVALVLLGVILIVAPRLGAAIFGLPAPEGPAMGYVPAIGVRDIAFGLYVLALAWFSGRRAAGIVLAITVLIPIGDILVLLALTGLSSPGHLALHAASGVYMSGAAAWLLGVGRRRKGAST
jgi:hypothetical protein